MFYPPSANLVLVYKMFIDLKDLAESNVIMKTVTTRKLPIISSYTVTINEKSRINLDNYQISLSGRNQIFVTTVAATINIKNYSRSNCATE